MRIDRGGSETAVPRQLLNGSDVEVRLEQMAGETVAKGVGRGPLADPGLPDGFPDRLWGLRFMAETF